jgi:hypothetical protein
MQGQLGVAANGRHLTRDGQPWFLLADTAWELLHRLNDEDSDHYLRVRADQGFNAIMTVAVAEFGGADVPTPDGNLPFYGRIASRPDPDYWAHVDRTITRANELGLYVGLLPCWGSYWYADDELFSNPDDARSYAAWIADRYQDADVYWILGGDRYITQDRHRKVMNTMAGAIRSVVGDRQLISYHPNESSKDDLGDVGWLDFDMIQSGHQGWAPPNYQLIEQHYSRPPLRPIIDGEPNYEAHPVMDPTWHPAPGWTFSEADQRRAFFHSICAGSCGHVYGANGIYQFLVPGWDDRVHGTPGDWREALFLPGATQVVAAARLVESIRFAEWEPRQDLLMSRIGQGRGHQRARARRDGTAVSIYAPSGRPVSVDIGRLNIDSPTARWWDPRAADWGPARAVTGWPEEIPNPFTGDDGVLFVVDADRPVSGVPTATA